MREARSSAGDRLRVGELLRIVPEGLASVLDIGARDGYISNLVGESAGQVVAVDLECPRIKDRRANVHAAQADATRLPFADEAFEAVLCSEVLEHIPRPALERACGEIARVARRYVILGVPYRQDLRSGEPRCLACGALNAPWGHVNSFDEGALAALFPGWNRDEVALVGATRGRSNAVSAWLMRVAGNPYGTYAQEEPCAICGAPLRQPDADALPLARRICAGVSLRLQQMQNSLLGDRPAWIHLRLTRA